MGLELPDSSTPDWETYLERRKKRDQEKQAEQKPTESGTDKKKEGKASDLW